ncbi:nitroreductase family protein [uncultured Tistrella sp.]|uniref:nitroreductase family protein n=1 Tax=Tistrella mobilis TaxID=171437 RepID=UPI0026108EC2|nr:nitroreductase family protein [uncultured Tistrella sp.]
MSEALTGEDLAPYGWNGHAPEDWAPDLAGIKRAAAEPEILPLLSARWSPRAFADVDLSLDDLAPLFEAARWAPSANNQQPWVFVAASRSEDPEGFERLANCLLPGNRRWAPRAPVLMLAAARTLRPDGKPIGTALYDLGLAVGMMSVQATAEGLWLHQMAGFDAGVATGTLGLPEDVQPVAMIAIGPIGDAAELPEDLRGREISARERQPRAAFIHRGRFGG